jgi:hypothetical protein
MDDDAPTGLSAVLHLDGRRARRWIRRAVGTAVELPHPEHDGEHEACDAERELAMGEVGHTAKLGGMA